MANERHVQKKKHQSIWYDVSYGIVLGLFVGLLCVFTIYLITIYRYSYINTVLVSGNSVVPAQRIQRSVHRVMSEYCMIHASCRYELWLPIDHIQQQLLTEYPRIERANIAIKDGVMSVNIRERNIAFRFCTSEERNYCYFADFSGVLFERAPIMSDLRTIPTVIPDKSKIRVDIVGKSLPTPLWSAQDRASYHALIDIIQPYARIYTIRYSRRDLNVEVDKLYGYSLINNTAILKFNWQSLRDKNQFPYIVASIERLRSFQPFSGRFSVFPGSLEYLDFRFPKRLYMKFEQSISEDITGSL